jgi:cell wall-associated NlpC family hydrolase
MGYPRRHVVSISDAPPAHVESGACNPDYVYIGKSCAGFMHFDCLGFLSHVFTRVRGQTTRYSLEQWAQQGRPAGALNDLRPGDLILWPNHICIVTRNDGHPRIAHAAGDRHGVVEEPLSRSDVQGICLPDRFFGR